MVPNTCELSSKYSFKINSFFEKSPCDWLLRQSVIHLSSANLLSIAAWTGQFLKKNWLLVQALSCPKSWLRASVYTGVLIVYGLWPRSRDTIQQWPLLSSKIFCLYFIRSGYTYAVLQQWFFTWEAIALQRTANFIRKFDRDLNKNEGKTVNSVEITYRT